ncbi:hypothetical protein FB451DRAFT_275486 [Mycena latifolia]|nr:hypothetical protein FB451DRAFT_275486 [Mycena latifolia]
MVRRMDDLMAESKAQFPDIYNRYTGRTQPATATRPKTPPAAGPEARSSVATILPLPRASRSQLNAQAGPSRPHNNAEAGPSRSRTLNSPTLSTPRPPASLPTASSLRLPTTMPPVPTPPAPRASPVISVSTPRPSLPTTSSSRLPPTTPSMPIPPPRAPLPRRASPAITVSTDSIRSISPPSPTSKPMPPIGTKRKATSPASAAPPPPAKRRLPIPRDPLTAGGSASMPKISAAAPSKPRTVPLTSPSRPSTSFKQAASSSTPTASGSKPRLAGHAGPPPPPHLATSRASTASSTAASTSTRHPRPSLPRASTSTSTTSSSSHAHTRAVAARSMPARPSPEPRRSLKRKADDDIATRACACGTLLPPPDVHRGDVCDTCRSSKGKKAARLCKYKCGALLPPQDVHPGIACDTCWARFARLPPAPNLVPSSSSSSIRLLQSDIMTGAQLKAAWDNMGAFIPLQPDVLVPQPPPLPGNMRKGKARESVKSLRLQTETNWSTLAESKDGAAGITFVNDVDDEELPSSLSGEGWEFEYLEDEYYRAPNLDPSAQLPPAAYFAFCVCEGATECLELKHCGCQDAGESEAGYAYTDGLFNFNYALNEVVVECNPWCQCSTECPNRVTQRPRKIPIEVFKTARCGWGVRTPVDVEKGTVLGVYTGRLIPREEAEKLNGEEKEYCFDLDYNGEGEYTVDSLKYGNWTRFINHSCEPNLRVQPVVYDTLPFQNMAYLAFITTEQIPARTELTFDYDPEAQREHEREVAEAEAQGGARKRSKRPSQRPSGATDCVCRAPRYRCRGWVRTI